MTLMNVGATIICAFVESGGGIWGSWWGSVDVLSIGQEGTEGHSGRFNDCHNAQTL